MTLSEFIIQYRKAHKLSQRQFAIICDVSNVYISLLEKGINPTTNQPVTPTLPQLNKLAQGMNMTVAELFHAVDDMPVDLSSMTILTTTEEKLLKCFRMLNDVGQTLTFTYMDHMLAMDPYRREPQVGTPTAGHTGDVRIIPGKDGPVAVPRHDSTLKVASPRVPLPFSNKDEDPV